MRTLASFLLVSTLVLGIHALASGEDEKDALQKRVELLELQAELLMEREAALSAYVLRNGARADALEGDDGRLGSERFTGANGSVQMQVVGGVNAASGFLRRRRFVPWQFSARQDHRPFETDRKHGMGLHSAGFRIHVAWIQITQAC